MEKDEDEEKDEEGEAAPVAAATTPAVANAEIVTRKQRISNNK